MAEAPMIVAKAMLGAFDEHSMWIFSFSPYMTSPSQWRNFVKASTNVRCLDNQR